MLTDVAGVRVGHWTDPVARTGCTVVLFPDGTVGSGEVRGGAPATREFALLEVGRLVERLDAVVFTGGSAFGLAAADGVVRWCAERGVGFPTVAGPVPIVVAAAVFDLAVGDPAVRPGPAEGYAACEAATAGAHPVGGVGAGTGATVAKWRGAAHRRPGGVGAASVSDGPLVVAALAVVNAYGDTDGPPDELPDAPEVTPGAGAAGPDEPFGNTTLVVVATNARLDRPGCHLVAQSAHDGFARALFPAHTRVDGDAVVVGATGGVEAGLDRVRMLAVMATERAIRSGARPGGSAGGHGGGDGSA